MSSADLTGIDGVVAEVLVGDITIFVANQAVVGHHIGVEIDLDFGIQGDDLQGGGQVFNEEFAGFIDIVYVGIISIAIIGQRFHHHVIQVAYTTD